MSTWSGKTIGKVVIEDLIARGGMAEVYKGLHTTLGRPVAVKVMRTLLEEDPGLRTRFEREARVVAGLRHPNIVQIFDFDIADDQPYIIMEYINGPSLGAYMRGHAGGFPLPVIGRLLSMLGSALDYAHLQGVIHRDIKPANVLLLARSGSITPGQTLPDDFEAILTDFGLLRVANSSTQTASGFVAGTPAYMSPEQARGEQVDARSDLYALGVMLYEMLSGRVPFESDTTMGVLLKHIQEPPPPVPELPASLQTVLMRALAKDPAERYQNGRELTQAFLEASNLTLADVQPATPQTGSVPTVQAPALNERATLPPTPTPPPSGEVTQQSPAPAAGQPAWINAAILGAAILAGMLALAWAFSSSGQLFASQSTPAVTENPTTLATQSSAPSESQAAPHGGEDPMSETATGDMETFGLLRFYDVAAFLDEVILITSELPAAPAGAQYEAWLVGEETRLSLGLLVVDETGRGEITYLDAAGTNLLSRYNHLEITLEPQPDNNPATSGEVVYSSGIPSGALVHIRHLFVSFSDTPNETGLIIGLQRETRHVDEHSRAMVTAYQQGDADSVRLHAESIYNLLVGKNGQGFGDLDGDGTIANPGDGYGLLFNGSNQGYIQGTISHTQFSMSSPDATLNVKIHGQHVIDSARNVETWATELRDLMLMIMDDPAGEQTNALIRQAAALADRMQNGRDLNGNESIEPIQGEGGVLTVLDHAGYMIDMPLMEGPGMLPPPAPADAEPGSEYEYTP